MSISALLIEAGSKIPGNLIVWKVLFCLAVFWTLLEIGFLAVVQFIILPRAQKLSKTQPYHGDMMVMMRRAVDLVKQLHCYDFEKYLSGFCRGADFKDICVENFRSFLAWAMYNKHMPDCSPEEIEKLNQVQEYAIQEHPCLQKMRPGYNPKIKHCRMTLDPIPILHRPLLMYVLIRLKEAIASFFYIPAYGFQALEIDGQTYWYKKQREDNNSSASKTVGSNGNEPILFLHGITTGWGGYVPMACAMGAGRDIILVDLESVKLNSLEFQMPTPQQFSEKLIHILDRHNIERVSLVGHSFGSMTAGWFLRHHPDRISHLTLIDPVSMLLSFPEVAYSFLYRKPSSVMEWIIHLFAAREITISHTLRRNFWWYNNDLWLEAIPERIGVVVGIATHDEITNPKALQEYVYNCRNARIQARECTPDSSISSKVSLARSVSATTDAESCSSNSDTDNGKESASMTSLLATAESFTCLESLDRKQKKSSSTTSSAGATVSVCRKEVAMIECLVWDNYSHGQILFASQEHHTLVATMRSNEKLGTASM